MGIQESVTEHMKAAMRAKQADRLRGLRGIRAGIILAMKEDGRDTLDDAACIAVLKKLAKQRRDSIEAYVSAEREDLAQKERDELAVIEEFLPAGPSEATVRGWVAEAIAATGATSPREMGKVMGMVMKAHRGEADGNLVRQIATELLS